MFTSWGLVAGYVALDWLAALGRAPTRREYLISASVRK
jgi:hypothetical protein